MSAPRDTDLAALRRAVEDEIRGFEESGSFWERAANEAKERGQYDATVTAGTRSLTWLSAAIDLRAMLDRFDDAALRPPRETAAAPALDRKLLAVAIAHVADEDGFGYDDDHAAGMLAAEYEHLLARLAAAGEPK